MSNEFRTFARKSFCPAVRAFFIKNTGWVDTKLRLLYHKRQMLFTLSYEMPRKTNINNLIIVWQGQSWSVIAPNGLVLSRYKYKDEAETFAENIETYLASVYPEYDEDDIYQKIKNDPDDYIPNYAKLDVGQEKRKNDSPRIEENFAKYRDRVGIIKYVVAIPLAAISGFLLIIGVGISVINIISSLIFSGLDKALLTLLQSLLTLLFPYQAFVFGMWYAADFTPHQPDKIISNGDRDALIKYTVMLPVAIFSGVSWVLGLIVGLGHSIFLLLSSGLDHAAGFLLAAFVWTLIAFMVFMWSIAWSDRSL